jgi:hypothetical protein
MYCRMCTYALSILCAYASPLHDEFLVSKLHTVQSCARLQYTMLAYKIDQGKTQQNIRFSSYITCKIFHANNISTCPLVTLCALFAALHFDRFHLLTAEPTWSVMLGSTYSQKA